MNQNTEFLNYIYQNSQMGIDTINQLTNIVEDPDFSEQLSDQLLEYQSINTDAVRKLQESGAAAKGLNKATELSAYMSIGIKTLADKSPEHISEMMIEGSTRGVMEVTKNLKKYEDADNSTISLANKLLKTEQHNIEQLKQYL